MDEQLRAPLGQLEHLVAEAADYFGRQVDTPAGDQQSWGAREVLAHMLFWHERTCINAERVLAGQPPEAVAGPVDEVNADAVAIRKEQPLGRLVEDLLTLQRRLSAAYQRLEDMSTIVMVRGDGTTFTPPQRLEVMSRHFRNHLDELRGG